MVRATVALAVIALVASLAPAPGMYIAVGAGIGAIGWGWVGFGNRAAGGTLRLWSAAGMAIGAIGLLLGGLRIALTLAAIDKLERMLGG